jgi:low affinity Fe/Cu permease
MAKKDRINTFEMLAISLTKFTGRTSAFVIALSIIIIWAFLGPVFNFSDTWQLVINTGTTIITFLMVFLIQRTQNKDSMAIQLKLNELIASLQGASNRLVDVEELSEKDLETLKKHYDELVKLARRDHDIQKSHSIEEAERRHEESLPKKK